MSAPSTPSEPYTQTSMLGCDAMIGVILEVRDLDAAQRFFQIALSGLRGQWEMDYASATFRCDYQAVSLARTADPRVFNDSGQHLGVRLPASERDRILNDLRAAGYPVDWWREDHPAERGPTPSPYVRDPTGNRCQLIAGAPRLIDHFMIETHDLEAAEVFWTRVVGGSIDYYHGRRSRDYTEALAWGDGSDPCAPWTRLWPGTGVVSSQRAHHRAPHPNQQLFLNLGSERLGIALAPRHRQEPPEEQVIGTPRIVLRTPLRASEAVDALTRRNVSLHPEERLRIPWTRVGTSLYLRDPAGNFVEVRCREG